MNNRIIRCVLSGSFRRDHSGLERSYRELVANGCQILSPHRLRFIDTNAEFVIDNDERDTSLHVLEDHHLLAIRQADFLWVHIFNGHIGLSTAMEIGFAKALNVPVYSNESADDITLREYIQVKPSVFAVIELLEVKND